MAPSTHGVGRLHDVFERALARWSGGGLSVLRWNTGAKRIEKTRVNVFSRTRMLAFRDFRTHSGSAVPPAYATRTVARHVVCGPALLAGAYICVAGLVVAFNFLIAIVVVDARQPYAAAFPALALLAAGLCLAVIGAGRGSADHRLREAS